MLRWRGSARALATLGHLVAAVLLALPLGGCMSSRMADSKSDRLFRDGRYAEAAERLRAGLKEEGDGDDRLLYLMDLGLALHAAGDYAESTKVLLEADKLSEVKEYTSLSEEVGTLLTSETTKAYRGEDFEHVLISTYLAMNFALLGDFEGALVECKRVHRKLERMNSEGGRKYKQNAFARYLAGVLYEASGEIEDAQVDYRKTRELVGGFDGGFRPLGLDLWRAAWLMRDPDAQARAQREYSLREADLTAARLFLPKSGLGQVVVLYENGISPIKRPNPDFVRLPRFYPRPNPVRAAGVTVDGREVGETYALHDIEATAIQNLEDKYAAMVAKRIAGVVAKEVVAHQIEKQTNSPLAGFLARVFFHASDQADTRSWNLLPRDLQILRFTAEPGEREVRLKPRGGWRSVDESQWVKRVSVKAGKTVFVNFRYTP
ncbi:MAG: hypothetical protein IT285_00570 [Bdellovibrionales bacterium]|nr:hypothetical protein [Bdellovibrionales bacterium]